MDTYADDLAELTEKLDLKHAVHVGHSTGGGEVARYIDQTVLWSCRCLRVPLHPQIGVTAGIASGNRGGSGSPLGTFNPLFPTGFYFGQGGISLLGPSNLIEAGPHITLQLTRSLSLIADDHTFWRNSLQDGVYGLGVNLLVPGQGNSGRYIGNQPSVGVYWNASHHLSVSTAYGHFFVGSFLKQASPLGKAVDYAAVWTTYKF